MTGQAYQHGSRKPTGKAKYANAASESSSDTVIEFRPFHLSVSGFEISGSNKLLQPKVTFSNMAGDFTDLMLTMTTWLVFV